MYIVCMYMYSIYVCVCVLYYILWVYNFGDDMKYFYCNYLNKL